MRFYWVRDQQQQGHFNTFWAPGADNLADYFTKHFPATCHQTICLHTEPHITTTQDITNTLLVLKGCVKPPSWEAQSCTNDEVS
jgi:hypothetical protein